jgi:glycosyltransferase 2 family protein
MCADARGDCAGPRAPPNLEHDARGSKSPPTKHEPVDMNRSNVSRGVKSAGTLLLTAACLGYILWKIDLGRTVHLLAHARLPYFAAAVTVWLAAMYPMALRWKRLLAVRGVEDGTPWLLRTSFVSYAAAQVLPTSIGGDASRIFEGTRRHPGKGSTIAGSVLLERALGGAATLTLAAVGFVLAIGRYDVGPYLWIELAFIVGTAAGAFVLFSPAMRRPLALLVPTLRRLRLARPLQAAYEGVHAYRRHSRTLLWAFALTLFVQTFRVGAIWLVGKSVGVNLSPRPYYVMGPMLFLVMLVPLTINGAALREAFFVSFLGKLNVGADAAFATGFLFFLLSFALAIPGAIILAWEAIGARRSASDGPSSSSG